MIPALLLALSPLAPLRTAPPGESRPPNVVLILTDDQGYGDLSCAGHPTIRTPRLDALAAGGLRLTQFYMAAPVCSPSRAALLTGCYPVRVGMHRHVVFPADDHGLHPDEETLAEALAARGYATGCFGKWHLGHRRGMLPTDQGFDEWTGIPYSNDMAQVHRPEGNRYEFRLPWIEDGRVAAWEPDQRTFTRRLTQEAIAFVRAHAHEPFFVYLPHPMPHIPLHVSERGSGGSPRGLYGDVIEELDRCTGELVDALAELDLLEDTLILFTSDNGPWLPMGLAGGSAGPLKGGKGTNHEGGQRVPLIAHWPARIAPGLRHEVVTAMDLLPTVLALVDPDWEPAREIDGRDLSGLLLGLPGTRPEERPFLYYTSRGDLAGLRSGPWKLLLEGPTLHHLEHDISERFDLAPDHPDRVRELTDLAHTLDAHLRQAARPELRGTEPWFDPRRP